MQLAKLIWDFSKGQGLLRPGDRVVVGVSGGPDSLCLLDVMHRLAGKHELELHVAHLNHGLRREARADAEFVRAEANKRACRFWTETVNVRAAAQAGKLSLETAARQLRYDFLRRTAEQAGADRVAVAHTADDQAETVLMHLLRGTGLRGLRGMLPKTVIGDYAIGNWHAPGPDRQFPIANLQSPVYLVRPLLHTTRSDVLAYCAEHKLSPRLDRSNRDRRFTRNRVRRELLPALEAFNPNIRVVLARLAQTAAGDYEIWLEAVRRLWQATARPDEDEPGQAVFDRQRWLGLGGAQRRALLRAAIEQLTGEVEDVDFAPIEAAAEFSRHAAPGRSCQVVRGLVLKVDPERIRLAIGRSTGRPDWPWMAGDRLAAGWQVIVESLMAGEQHPDDFATASRWTAEVDAEKLAGPLGVRSRQPGDRFQPLGMGGHTVKLSDFLINQKIPVSQREQWPLLVCGDDIVWVAGLRLDERYKVTPLTRAITRLSIRPTEGD